MQASREYGFTLIETMIAAAIAATLTGAVVLLASRSIAAAGVYGTRLTSTSAAGDLGERLSSDAASALAIGVPAVDAWGANNADGHEVDFFSADESHRPYRWAYAFNARSATVTRYAIAGAAAIAGSAFAPVNAFVATALRASDVSNPAASSYDPLFAAANATDVAIPLAAQPGAFGGNGLVELRITASGVDRRIDLAAADTPTAFTVVVAFTPSPAPVPTATPAPLAITTP
jgi:prepilin-type N-terminal cleavage/methylation domain-containing protein